MVVEKRWSGVAPYRYRFLWCDPNKFIGEGSQDFYMSSRGRSTLKLEDWCMQWVNCSWGGGSPLQSFNIFKPRPILRIYMYNRSAFQLRQSGLKIGGRGSEFWVLKVQQMVARIIIMILVFQISGCQTAPWFTMCALSPP